MADGQNNIDYYETASSWSNPRVDGDKATELTASITQDDVTP
jgi:hypothetical protein